MIANIEQAFQAIEAERKYQDQKWPDQNVKTPTEWLVYIENYVDEAKKALSREPDEVAVPFALHTLRKIAAMAVAAMQQNGVLTRAVEGPRPVGETRSGKKAASKQPFTAVPGTDGNQ